jgi:NitT/TauT family transport system substrate-binding protein
MMRTLLRLTAISAALVLAACGGASSPQSEGGSSGEPTTVRFRFDWVPNVSYLPYLAAKSNNYFADEGVNVQMTVGSGSTDSVTLTGAGQFDIGIAAAPAVLAGVDKGVPIVSVGAIYQTNSQVYISLPDKPIRSPRDMVGKKIGIRPGIDLLQLQLLLKKNGIPADQVTTVNIGEGQEPLLNRQVDAVLGGAYDQLVVVSEAIGQPAPYFRLSDFGVNPYFASIIANKRFAEGNPDAVKGFVAAYARGIKWSLDNPEQAMELLRTSYPDDLSQEYVSAAVPAIRPYWTSTDTATHGLLYQNPERYQTDTIALAKQLGQIEKDLKFEEVASNDFLPSPAIVAEQVK